MLRKLAFGAFLLLTGLSIIFAFRDDKTVTTKSSEAYQHYLAGVDLCDKFYYRQATKEFELAIALDSAFAVAEARLAQTYRMLGFKQKHDEMWDMALANKQKVSEREQLLLDLWKAEEGDDPALTSRLAEQYIAKYPDHLEGYINLGNTEYGKENWERALELYQKALKIDPSYALAYNMLGYLNYFLGRYDDALMAHEKYIELCPNQANPHDSRGEILYAIGRYEEALGEFREAFNINPDLDFPVLHMAATYGTLGELRQVDYCFQTLYGQAPNEYMKYGYLTQRARIHVDCHQYDTAEAILNKVIQEDTDPEKGNAAAAVAVKGLIAYCRRDASGLSSAWEQRRAYLQELLKKRPGLSEQAGVKRAFLYRDATMADLAGDLATAAMLFADIVDSTKNPTEKVGMRTLYADVLWRAGNNDQAKSELQKNLSINPNHPRSLVLLADILDSEGNRIAADSFRQRALAVWKNADIDYKPLAELQDKMSAPVAAAKRNSTKP
jgi:tetratricopeptide (TPR) repeat protein